jgi:transcriptional regulator with XRE-family HTH domain
METRHTHAGLNLKHYRERAGFSLRAFARRAGYAPSTLSRWETGKSGIPYKDARKCAEVLGIPVALIWDHVRPVAAS